MQNGITRKDFLNGVACTIGATMLGGRASAQEMGPDKSAREYFLEKGITQNDARYYPPKLTGMRGSHPGAFEGAHALRDGNRWDGSGIIDTGEHYDLVIVGGGISGLAAAHFFRKAKGPGAKILILDNHDDFGGHAKRNEFCDGNLIGYGGTQEIEGWPNWSPEANGLLKDLGIEPQRFDKEFYQHDFRKKHGLKFSVFFDKETFGADVMVNDIGLPTWEEFVKRTPLNEQARRDLVRFQTAKVDYMPGLSTEEKIARLNKMSFQTFLEDYVKVDPQVVAFFQNCATGGFGVRIDASPAMLIFQAAGFYKFYWEGVQGPTPAALEGMGLPMGGGFPGGGNEGADGKEPFIFYHFPDGNASIARMLVRSLIPGSAPGSTMTDIVTAKMDYTKLDQPSSNTRIRLNSTAGRVRNIGNPANAKGVDVTYMRDGKVYRVRGGAAILACYNMIVPYLCPDLPEKQKEALHMAAKVPLVYANAQLRQWTSLEKMGMSMAYCPGSYFSEVYMDFPVSIGDYHYSQGPDQPVVLHMVRVPCSPGQPARQQRRIGRMELYTTPFETFETNIKDQLQRMLGSAGFNAERDIEAITVNRWPHGYADAFRDMDDPDWPEHERPNIVGRQQFGRISIANSDAAASAQTQAAMDEAYRAVQEILQA